MINRALAATFFALFGAFGISLSQGGGEFAGAWPLALVALGVAVLVARGDLEGYQALHIDKIHHLDLRPYQHSLL